MDKSEVMAFVKRCLDELKINYDTYDDCIDITFESDDDIFPIQVGIFSYEDTITTFAGIDGMEIPSNRRGAVLEYSNKYNCEGINDDGNLNAYIYISTDDETGKDSISTYSRTLVWETMDTDEFSAFTLSTLWALKAVMRGIFRLTM